MQRKISQADFDAVLLGIRQQGGPSVFGSACSYRGAGGFKCAAGWLIADEDYTPELEGRLAEMVPVLSAREDVRDISELQIIHDDTAISLGEVDTIERFTAEEFFPVWEPRMAAFAAARGLNYTPPTT